MIPDRLQEILIHVIVWPLSVRFAVGMLLNLSPSSTEAPDEYMIAPGTSGNTKAMGETPRRTGMKAMGLRMRRMAAYVLPAAVRRSMNPRMLA